MIYILWFCENIKYSTYLSLLNNLSICIYSTLLIISWCIISWCIISWARSLLENIAIICHSSVIWICETWGRWSIIIYLHILSICIQNLNSWKLRICNHCEIWIWLTIPGTLILKCKFSPSCIIRHNKRIWISRRIAHWGNLVSIINLPRYITFSSTGINVSLNYRILFLSTRLWNYIRSIWWCIKVNWLKRCCILWNLKCIKVIISRWVFLIIISKTISQILFVNSYRIILKAS